MVLDGEGDKFRRTVHIACDAVSLGEFKEKAGLQSSRYFHAAFFVTVSEIVVVNLFVFFKSPFGAVTQDKMY